MREACKAAPEQTLDHQVSKQLISARLDETTAQPLGLAFLLWFDTLSRSLQFSPHLTQRCRWNEHLHREPKGADRKGAGPVLALRAALPSWK